MRGGKFLAQGSFGCVYGDPPLKCGKKRLSNNFVVKTMSKKEADDELAEASVIKKIDPKSEFTIYPMRKCEITEIDKKHDNCLRDCEIWDVARKARGCKINKKNPVHGLVMKYGGTDLDNGSIESLYKPIFSVHTNDLLKPMYKVFKGIHKINKTHAHLDIKGLNLLYNTKGGANNIYFIDFGMLSPIDDLFNDNNSKVVERHDFTEYFAYPSDFGILNSFRKAFEALEEIYTDERVFSHPIDTRLLPDCKLVNILEALFRTLKGEKVPIIYSTSRKALAVKNLYSKVYGNKKELTFIINNLFDCINNLLIDLLHYNQDKNGDMLFKATPYYIKNELESKKKYFENLMNNIFGITIRSLKTLKIFKPLNNNFTVPSDFNIIKFVKSAMCYYAEVSFARGHKGIDKAFYKTFATRKDNTKPLPLKTIRLVKEKLNVNIERARVSVDTYGLSKALLSVVDTYSILRQANYREAIGIDIQIDEIPYTKNTIDFIKILGLLSHDSLDKRLILDENVLKILKYLAESKDNTTTKGNQIIFTYATAMKRYKELQRLVDSKDSVITKITTTISRVIKGSKDLNKELLEEKSCGINPKSGRCKLGMPEDGNCKLETKNGKNRCKKFDNVLKEPIKAPKVINKMKKLESCGVNPKSGRCKIGLPEDGKCELKTTKGKRRCLKLKDQEQFPTLKEWNRRRDTIKQLPNLPIGLLNRRKLTYTQAKDLFKDAVNAMGHTSLAEAFNDTAKKIVDVHNEIVPEYEGRAMGKVGVAIELKDYLVKPDFKLTKFMSKVVMLMIVEDRPVSVPVPGGMLTLDLGGYKWSLSYGDGKDYYFPKVNSKFGIDGFWPDEEYITKTKSPRNKLEQRYIVKIYGTLAEEYLGKGVLEGGLTYAQVKDLYKKDGKKTFAEAYNQYVRTTIAEVSEFYEGTLNVSDYIIYEDDPIENLVVKMMKLGEIDDHPITVDSPFGYINLDLDDIYDWTVEQGITLRDIKYKPRKRKVKVKKQAKKQVKKKAKK